MKTLIIVDPQNDFMPGGSLAVENGDEIVPVINTIQKNYDLVIATQDWHPQNHGSFASNHPGKQPFDEGELGEMDQTFWPDHCVQGSKGAEFHSDLNTDSIEAIFRKGMDSKIDSYSGFYDNGHKKSTGLSGYLREKGVKQIDFCGLAADICVYFTLKDAVKEGFESNLIKPATRPLDNDTFEKQLGELRQMNIGIL
ncbi:MAG TPA: bifunctional nicotinamidase/pyrazinamidase [Cryomorphaceae bacterium]|nr:bifunctional nicotinamidase/pyrazinamidase [Cryomorphaceae bacterium]